MGGSQILRSPSSRRRASLQTLKFDPLAEVVFILQVKEFVCSNGPELVSAFFGTGPIRQGGPCQKNHSL